MTIRGTAMKTERTMSTADFVEYLDTHPATKGLAEALTATVTERRRAAAQRAASRRDRVAS